MSQSISVITATLGKRPMWLAEAAKSLSEQTHKPLEWLVISPTEINLPNIDCSARLICVEANFAKASNIGHNEAVGEYVAYLADDDLKHPNFCQRMTESLGNHDAAMCMQYIVNERREPIGHYNPTPLDYKWQTTYPWNPIFLNGLLVRTAVARAAGFDERLNASEDYDYILRLIKSFRVARVNEYLAYLRDHPGQLSKDSDAAGGRTHEAMHIIVQNHPDLWCGRCDPDRRN